MKQIISLLIVLLFLVSCSPKASEEAPNGVNTMTTADNTSKDEVVKPSNNIKKVEVEKKIIKDGRLGINVSNLDKSKKDIDTLVKNLGGYYDNESLNNNEYSTEYILKIRIPSNNLEILISKIENGNDEVSYKEIDARDVTEEFIDLETRLVNKQKYINRYQELLRNAKSIKEILDIQEKIRVIEEEIESTTGRLKYLNDLVNYSTLELNISQKKEFKYTPEFRENFFEKLKQSLASGWYGLIDLFLFLLSIWAVLILISVIVYFWIKKRKKRIGK